MVPTSMPTPVNGVWVGSPAGVDPIDTILGNAKRNMVLRDVWASFFYHPFFIKRPGAEAELKRLLESLQAMGYEFVDLENSSARATSRPAPAMGLVRLPDPCL